MKTKTIFLALITLFISVASFAQYAGAGSGSGSGNGSSGVTGAGRAGHSVKHSSKKRSTHHSGASRKHKTHRYSSETMNNASAKTRTKTVSSMRNTGSSDGTMPDNHNPGKVTTSYKGKDGPTNGVVEKGVVNRSGHK